ncbi:MAG: DUF2283 domain-containing protein [Candidatus Vogelbacteria bacterium]|nr:DUF2283 domain-containing protein [Candidatus Vogelbacteria bacterium]
MAGGVESSFEEIAPGVSVESNAKGKVLGFEILNASRRLKPVFSSWQRQSVLKRSLAMVAN